MTDFAKIDKYEVIEQIGQGSFGTVYKGRDPFLKRDVAIKVCTLADEGLRKRFFREAEIAGKLQHKNIVTVFAFGFEGEVPYLVQEYLPGRDLRQLIEERTALPTVERLDYLLQVASGLEYAHGEGVVHRDIKPANVRRLAGGAIKIMDFGIAKLASAETQLTQKGVAMGTATYLPPEQVRGGDIDQRADIFSLGVLAYELLTFRRPFRGNTLSALVYQILYKPPAPISHAWNECPEPLAKVIGRCLEKDPERRYPAVEALVPELQAVREEIASGRWPEAEEPPAPPPEAPPGEPPPAAEPEARTIRIPAVGAPPEKDDSESTRPIPIIAADSPEDDSPEESSPEASPPEVSPPEVSPPEVSPPEVEEAADEPVLRTTAEEIQKLVVQGDLEEAQRQLEETIARQKAIEATPVRRTAVRPTADLQPLDRGSEPPESPPPPSPPPSPRPGVKLPAGLKKWGLAAAAAAAGLMLVLALGRLFGGGDSEPPPVAPPVAPPPPPAAPVSDPGPATGVAVVNALPWAEVTEITDADGFVRELPEPAHTPFVLELPIGGYRITLQHPDHPELQTCELEVNGSELVRCDLTFGEPSALEYFKDSGWWK